MNQTAGFIVLLIMIFPLRDNIPTEKTPFITYFLIAANIIVFFIQTAFFSNQAELARFLNTYALVPKFFFASVMNLNQFEHPLMSVLGPYISYMFLHGGVLHLVSNLIVLWIFGDNVEDRFGHALFLLFYVFCGVLAGLSQVLLSGMESGIPIVGASGAIAGIMGAYFLLYPKARVLVLVWICLIFPIEIPAVIFLGLWFFTQLQGAFLSNPEMVGTAWWTHISGFLTGCLVVWMFKMHRSRKGYPPPRQRIIRTNRNHTTILEKDADGNWIEIPRQR